MRLAFGGSFERWPGMNTRRVLGLALVIVAIGIAIALRSSADSTVKPGDVNESRIMADAATGINWLVNGRTNDSKHFSPQADQRSERRQFGPRLVSGLRRLDGRCFRADRCRWGHLRQRSALQGLRCGSFQWKAPLEVRSANPARSGAERLLLRAHQWRRGRLERKSLCRHRRLPPDCHRCRNGKENLGSHSLRTIANGNYRRAPGCPGENTHGLQRLG